MTEVDSNGLPRRGHGSVYMYQYKKCRCAKCRAANALAHRELMRRYAAGGGRGRHGTSYRYDTGCRCVVCKEAHNKKSREYKQKLRGG